MRDSLALSDQEVKRAQTGIPRCALGKPRWTCLTNAPYDRDPQGDPANGPDEARSPMTAPVAGMRVSTVAPRPSPARKGRRSSRRDAADGARGLDDPRGVTTAGPRARPDLARRRRARGRQRPGRVGTAGFGNPAAVELLPARAARGRAGRRRRSRASGSRCTARRSTSVAAASSCTRSAPSTSRSGTCSGGSSASPSTSCSAAGCGPRSPPTRAGSTQRRTSTRSPRRPPRGRHRASAL